MSRSKTSSPSIKLSEAQRRILEGIARQRNAPRHLVERARIVLAVAAVAEGERYGQITRRLGLHPETVVKWHRRWVAAEPQLQAVEEADGLATQDLAGVIATVLRDEPRSGAPPKFSAEQVAQIIAVACEKPSESDRPIEVWTARELADEVLKRQIVTSISKRQVGRSLRRGRVAAPS